MSKRKKTRSAFGRCLLFSGCVLALLPVSCSSEFSPSDIVQSDSTLVEVFAEVHLGRARQEIFEDFDVAAEDSVLERYRLGRQDYERLLRYYGDHPEAFADILERVVERLESERIAKPATESVN